MLKDQLLSEAQEIDASVELDSIFESVELSEDVKSKFSTVFESTVKKHAIALAESHINAIAEKADALVESQVEAKATEAEQKFVEKADKFFEHIAKEWLTENQVEIHKGIKADLFESMFSGLKTLVVEHNVVLPEESVDIVAEMEDELTESKQEATNLFEQTVALRTEVDTLKRDQAIVEATRELTESQKEKVGSLIEGLAYSDSFESKLSAIVEMATAAKTVETALTESKINKNVTADNADGLNYVVEAVQPAPEASNTSPRMSSYVNSATRI